MLTNARKNVISNIFRDLTKLAVVAMVFGQFVPGHKFSFLIFAVGVITASIMMCVAIVFAASSEKEET
jgi:hypothetical protein